MKKFLVVLISYAFVAGSAKAGEAELRATIALQQAQLAEIKNELIQLRNGRSVVGSLQQSFLTEAQFQAEMGANWVLCNGQDIAATYPKAKWISLTNSTAVPDCRDKFLRSQGSKTVPLRQPQTASTDVSKLSATSSSTLSNLSVSVSGELSGRLEVAGHSAFSGKNISWGDNGSVPGLSFSTGMTRDSKGVHAIYPIVKGTLLGQGSGTVTTTTALSSTDKNAETRPENITVNTFIRID